MEMKYTAVWMLDKGSHIPNQTTQVSPSVLFFKKVSIIPHLFIAFSDANFQHKLH